ncbi:alpha-L-fucosidase [Gaoshiqia sp. Z1-71]|uniref:alpha-L-fucosidase n=1 Tax=Gaoshiqia hydrogeniformans TaxID=3290090 RepID=UPI003BF8E932
MRSFGLLSVFILMFFCQSQSQPLYEPSWQSIDSRPVPEWFENSKFGIFIHWGLYSVPSWAPTTGGTHDKYSEWYWYRQSPNGHQLKPFVDFHQSMYGEKVYYQDFVAQFNAELFDPDQWAEIIKESGARYVVLTSKHHDGFCLWPSDKSWNWNSMDVGPHRDLCQEVSVSIKKSGLRMGFYYSLYEWFNPLYRSNVEKYVDEHMIPQLKDLVVRYQPEIIWTDGEWDHPAEVWKSTNFLAWLYNESPVKESVVVNDRWGKGTRSVHGGYFTTEYDLLKGQGTNSLVFNKPWEECRGVGGSFGYNRNENLEDYESSESLVKNLINKVARGGNLLLNIGPTADGRIPVIMQQRLADIGAWLKINGEAIYGTRKWEKAPPVTPTTSTFFTRKGKDLYLIVTEWQDDPIVLENIGKINAVELLGFSGNVDFSISENRAIIKPPLVSPKTLLGQYAWVYKLVGI